MKNIKYIISALLAIAFLASACTNAFDYDLDKPEEQQIIYAENFEGGSLGDFISVNVSGDQQWEGNERDYAMVTGYVDGQNLANEAWLISPAINLTGHTAAYVVFDHVPRYFQDLENEATVWISTGYESGSPETAEWTQLETLPFRDPGNWDFMSSGQISLTEFVGQSVRIGFKYISTASKAGTWEVKNFAVVSGEATLDEYTLGKGTAEDPFTVQGAMLNQRSDGKWVEGIIVGYVWSGQQTEYVLNADSCTQMTNILIADVNNPAYVSRTMPVQLPVGAVRQGLNLKEHPELLGKKVKLYGNLISYFSVPGLKEVSYYELEDGTTGGSKPLEPLFEESLTTQSSFAKFSTFSVKGDQIWKMDASYGAVMSGFDAGSSFENEDWLITPAINLSEETAAKLIFEHARGPAGEINTGVSEGWYTVWVSSNYTDGDPSTANWVEFTGVNHGTAAWQYVSSGELAIPTEHLTETARIGFKYISSAAKSATWEIRNVKVLSGEAVNEGGGDGGGTKEDPLTVAQARNSQNSEVKWVKGYIVGSVKDDGSISRIESNDDVVFGTSNIRNTVVLLADSKTETDFNNCVAVNLPGGAIRSAVNLVDNPGNLGKSLKVEGTLRVYFNVPGVRDLVNFELEGGGGDNETEGGTESEPFTVEQAYNNQSGTKWVEGVVVGYVKFVSGGQSEFIYEVDAGVEATNILIATSQSDVSHAMPVQLPAGDVRTKLNLKDNPGNLNKRIKLYGNLEAYLGVPGIRSVTYFELEDGTKGGNKPGGTDPDPSGILSESLMSQASFDKFAKVSVKGEQAWELTQYGATMSGYANNTSYENEDWLITPAMNLAGKSNVKLSFEHGRGPAAEINSGVAEGWYTVWVSNNYTSGDPNSATWTEIEGVAHSMTAWEFISSGELTIPAANLQANTKVAFKYLSIDGKSATWQIKNLLVK